MNLHDLLLTVLLSLTPISELRGAIPFAVARGATVLEAFAIAVPANALAGPIAYLFLATFHKLFYKVPAYARFFDRFVERARAKVHPAVEKYGYWGLLVFVAIPFPLTGAWTGVLGAWMLGMSRRKAMLMVALGVLVAGMIVALVVRFGVGAFDFFLKRV
jgi:uncharacterized membrane protein